MSSRTRAPRDPRRIWYLAGVGAVVLAITVALDLLVPYGDWLGFLIRGAAIFAYQTIFLSIVSSSYMVEMVRFFGNPFIRIHHTATLTALALITIHPASVAISRGTVSVFVPDTTSWYLFFLNGGRPAFYLFLIASLSAAYRGALHRGWRPLHWLTYLAFILATVHAILLGINFQFGGVQTVAILMCVAVVATFVHKRLPRPRPRRR